VVKDGAAEIIVGISRYSKIAGQNRCESALAVSDDWQHKGVGTALMRHLIELAKAQGLASVESTEFAENIDMRSLLHGLGFHLKADSGNASQVLYTLDLLAINEPGRISQPARKSMEKTCA
jgi:GNAT superfamily N-acetyltransferase